MYVVLKTVNGTTWMALGPFPTKPEAAAYAAQCRDHVCPAGEAWTVHPLYLPKF